MASQSKVLITDFNFSTGEAIKREASAEELIGFDIVEQGEIARREAETAKTNAKATLLERLGITADEAALLLG